MSVVLIATSLYLSPSPVEAAVCGDIHVVWAGGSGSVPGADPQFARFFEDDLTPRLGTEAVVSAYQLGQNGGFGGFDYPALGDLATLIDAEWWLPGNPYDNSVEQGRQELIAYLTDRAGQCPNEAFIVGGYSQGAHVIGEGLWGLDRAIRDRIAYVALFGDPRLDTGNVVPFLFSSVEFPLACALGPKPWVRGSAPCWISGGQLEPRSPYVPEDMQNRVGSWCRNFDGVCDGSFADLALALLPPGEGVHGQYFDEDSDSAVAAREVAVALQVALPAFADTFDVSWLPLVAGATGADLTFVFDTTGSMYYAINDAKAQASNLAQTWLQSFPNARVGLVEYRDHGDPFVARVAIDLTDNVADFQTALDGLVAQGGGDYPEAMLSGIMTALDGLTWREGATKTAVIIADAPGKDPEPITNFTSQQVSQHALEIDPVAIYGVNLGGSDVGDFMEPISTAAAGQVFVLEPGQSLSDALFGVIETVALNPVATLNGPYLAETGTSIRFRTDGSFDADAELVSYEWDFNGDGTVELTSTTPGVEYTYPGEFHGFAAVRVISSDGGSAIATADVTVDSVGLGDRLPIAPLSADATITGPDEITVSWTPAADDRAEAYEIYLDDGTLVAIQPASEPDSFAVSGLDLGQPVSFLVVASNSYGKSGAVATPAVSSATVQITSASAHVIPPPPPPPPCDPCPEAPGGATLILLSATGDASGQGATVTVDYRLWGIEAGGGSVLVADWAPTAPADGAFDSANEAFSIHDSRDNAGYIAYDLDARATAGGVSALVTVRVPFEYDTIPPTSSVDPLPASTTISPCPITVSATDNWSGPGAWIEVELWYRYRTRTNQSWGAWTGDFVTDSIPPYSVSFYFPDGKGYYEFYSIATDQSGNVEAPPASADATIRKQ